MQLQVSSTEVLRDDSLRYAAQARAAGEPVECHIWESLLHVFPASVGTLTAAKQVLNSSAKFLRHHLDEQAIVD